MDYSTAFIGIKIQFLYLISYIKADFPPPLVIVSFPKTTYLIDLFTLITKNRFLFKISQCKAGGFLVFSINIS